MCKVSRLLNIYLAKGRKYVCFYLLTTVLVNVCQKILFAIGSQIALRERMKAIVMVWSILTIVTIGKEKIWITNLYNFLINIFHRTTRSSDYAQVIEQSFGIWHTKCFPRNQPPNTTEIADICKQLGYKTIKKPDFRFIEDEDGKKTEANVNSKKYRESTKAEIVSKFSAVRLNSMTVFVKPSRPIARLVKWDKTDSEKCNRLEIKCEWFEYLAAAKL